MSTTIYRILDPKTGLFSTGTTYPRWTKTGKVWTTRGAMSNHFNVLGYERAKEKYKDCLVMEYRLSESPVGETPAINDIESWNERSLLAAAKENVRIQKLVVAAKTRALEKAQRDLSKIIGEGK